MSGSAGCSWNAADSTGSTTERRSYFRSIWIFSLMPLLATAIMMPRPITIANPITVQAVPIRARTPNFHKRRDHAAHQDHKANKVHPCPFHRLPPNRPGSVTAHLTDEEYSQCALCADLQPRFALCHLPGDINRRPMLTAAGSREPPFSAMMGPKPRQECFHDPPARWCRDRPVPLVRRQCRGGGQLLRGAVPQQSRRCRASRPGRLPGGQGGRRADGRVHADGPAIHGPQRRPPLQVQRGHLVSDPGRDPGRGGPLHRCTLGGARSRTMRLGERPLRRVVADRSAPADEIVGRCRSRAGQARLQRHDADEAHRYRDDRARG